MSTNALQRNCNCDRQHDYMLLDKPAEQEKLEREIPPLGEEPSQESL